MGKKSQLQQIAERLEVAISIFNYECKVEIDYESDCVSLVFSVDTDCLSSSFIDRFRSVVGDAGVSYFKDHLELYGFPLLAP